MYIAMFQLIQTYKLYKTRVQAYTVYALHYPYYSIIVQRDDNLDLGLMLLVCVGLIATFYATYAYFQPRL